MRIVETVLGMMVGVATGVALGVMFAPDQGSNTRKKMIQQGEDLAHQLNNRLDKRFNELTKSINELIHQTWVKQNAQASDQPTIQP